MFFFQLFATALYMEKGYWKADKLSGEKKGPKPHFGCHRSCLNERYLILKKKSPDEIKEIFPRGFSLEECFE